MANRPLRPATPQALLQGPRKAVVDAGCVDSL